MEMVKRYGTRVLCAGRLMVPSKFRKAYGWQSREKLIVSGWHERQRIRVYRFADMKPGESIATVHVLDDMGRVSIPKHLITQLDLGQGDIFSVTAYRNHTACRIELVYEPVAKVARAPIAAGR